MKKFNFDLQIGLTEETRVFVCNQLTIILSDQYVLFTKLFKYHWNVKGQNFGPLHALFEKGYRMMFDDVDETAERIVQLGFQTPATLKEFLTFSRLEEHPGINPIAEDMILFLVNDFQSIIIQIRECINLTDSTYRDMGTNNFLTDLIQKYEKYVWLLRSHIEK